MYGEKSTQGQWFEGSELDKARDARERDLDKAGDVRERSRQDQWCEGGEK